MSSTWGIVDQRTENKIWNLNWGLFINCSCMYTCVFQRLDQLCVIVAMMSEERSCSFQVFLRSGLAVSNNPGSPYPKKHLQGTPTSGTINAWTYLMDCALFTPFIYQTKASVCNYGVVSFQHKSVQLVTSLWYDTRVQKKSDLLLIQLPFWWIPSLLQCYFTSDLNQDVCHSVPHSFEWQPAGFCRLNTNITLVLNASEAPPFSSRGWQHCSKWLTQRKLDLDPPTRSEVLALVLCL